MLFHDKLDFLMNLTDMANSKLARDANLDPSLISRWRRGIKVPALHSDAMHSLAKALAHRVNADFRKTKFIETSGIDAKSLSDIHSIIIAILEWFADGNEDTHNQAKPLRRKPYPSYQDRQVSPLDSLSVAESYCVGKEGRIKALQWIMSFVEHWPSGGTLRFYTDQSTNWLEVDHEFYRKVVEQNSQIVSKFNIVKFLLPVNSPAANHLSILEFAKIFIETATVSINYVRQNEHSMFQHSMGIYDNNIAISCYGFYSRNYLPTHLHSDERFIHELTTDFEANFNSAEIALRFVPRFTIWDMCRDYTSIFTQNATVYYRSSQVFLPFIPIDVLNEVLDDSETTPDASGLAYSRFEELLDDFLAQNMLFVSMSSQSFRFSQEDKQNNPSLFTQEDQRVYLTPNQCISIIENIIKVHNKHNNLFIIVGDEEIKDHFLVQERKTLSYARITDRFIPYQSHHPHLVQVICKSAGDELKTSLIGYNRETEAAKLVEIIDTLKSDSPEYL